MATIEDEIDRTEAAEAVQGSGDMESRTGGVRLRVWAYAVASLLAGVAVFLVEAIDRIATLWVSFNSPLEPLLFATYLAPTILLAFATGLAVACILGVVRLAYLATSRAAVRVPARFRPTVAIFATVAGFCLLFWIAGQVYPDVLERPLLEVVRKVNLRVASIPSVVANFSILYYAGATLGFAGLLAADLLLSWRPAGRWRGALATLAVLSLVAMVGFYVLDSRVQFGRYDVTLHLPATICQFVAAFFAAGFAIAAMRLGPSELRRYAPWVVGGLVLAIAASGFAAMHVGSNENLKAMLWRRSIVARRAYQLVAILADRDRDGATSLFAGADLDDRDPAVEPFATEIPGNGVDDNCFGGDAEVQNRPVAFAPESPIQAAPTGYNVVLIAIDTLRSRSMSVYGYERPTTPRIAEYAERGRFFPHAYSMSSNTGLTFASMQRSASRAAVFDKNRPTMFATLAEDGYRTAQINSASDSRWLAPRTWRRYRKVIMDGIQTVTHQEDAGLWDADRVTDEAIAYLGALPQGTRHATWVHYLDPHEPRRKMDGFDFGDSDLDIYDSTIAFTDREVGRLLDYLRDTGALENTVVVLMSDHGENFGEHGMKEHGNRPHGEQIEVPTIIWAPGIAPARVESPASTVDLAPTILNFLGLPAIPGAEGVDLLGDDPSPRPVYIETPANLPEPSFFSFAVVDGTWRLIYDIRGNTVELYDHARDPNELHNLADAEPEKLAEMKTLLAAWLDSTGSVRPFGKRDEKRR